MSSLSTYIAIISQIQLKLVRHLDRMLVIMKTITLEPFILLFSIVLHIQLGAQIDRNLLMWKICHLELNYSLIICENLSENRTVQSEVQISMNNFEMVLQIIF